MWNETLPFLLDPKSKKSELMHGLTSVGKAVTSEFGYNSIKEARRACGGLGYSHYTGFGPFIHNQDVHCTWEGDNNVLF